MKKHLNESSCFYLKASESEYGAPTEKEGWFTKEEKQKGWSDDWKDGHMNMIINTYKISLCVCVTTMAITSFKIVWLEDILEEVIFNEAVKFCTQVCKIECCSLWHIPGHLHTFLFNKVNNCL